MQTEITMACRNGQLRPGYGINEDEITMACRNGQLRPGYGINEDKVNKTHVKVYKKVA